MNKFYCMKCRRKLNYSGGTIRNQTGKKNQNSFEITLNVWSCDHCNFDYIFIGTNDNLTPIVFIYHNRNRNLSDFINYLNLAVLSPNVNEAFNKRLNNEKTNIGGDEV